ncbi:MAG TPA: type II toxin-antitoxin system VapC family toxin [Acetobacteraceae bacterium]|jgi:predicted nucleic acid-binding protein|nr:type II toxin-antitoxin system VapC family toxin [Acetobacteraceae bacterium]
MADTATRVIDASALAAVIFDEIGAEAVVERVGDRVLVAPTLIDFELVNACISKMRRNPLDRGLLLQAYGKRWSMMIETVEIDHTAVLALAQRTGLTGYDASYLHLAMTLETELVTLDRQLAAAAEKFR